MSDFFDVSDLGGLSDADFTTGVNKTNSLVSCFSLITKIHIRKRARSLRISDRCNYRDVLAEIRRINYSDCKIVFSWLFDLRHKGSLRRSWRP